jgi:hypothetical protein
MSAESDPEDPMNFDVHPDEDYGARFYKTDKGFTLEIFTPVFRVDLTGDAMPDIKTDTRIGWKTGSEFEARDDKTKALLAEILAKFTHGGRRRRTRKTRRRYRS